MKKKKGYPLESYKMVLLDVGTPNPDGTIKWGKQPEPEPGPDYSFTKATTKWDIWVEGYASTGSSADASLVASNVPGIDFDDAVKNYMVANPKHGIEPYTRANFISDKAFKNRRSNWNIWACALFPTEAEARKSFG